MSQHAVATMIQEGNKGIAWEAMFHMPLCFFDFLAAGTEDHMTAFTSCKAAWVICPMAMTPPGPAISPSPGGKHISGWGSSVPPSLRAFWPAPGVVQQQNRCSPQSPAESGGKTKRHYLQDISPRRVHWRVCRITRDPSKHKSPLSPLRSRLKISLYIHT